MLESEDGLKFRTIGVHVGNLDNKNYSTMLIENVFLDFLLPTLQKFTKEYCTGDSGDQKIEDKGRDLLLEIEEEYDKLID